MIRIKVFNTHGNFRRKWGSRGKYSGQFFGLGLICVDDLGHVFVCDYGNDRIQIFKSDGTFVTEFGTRGKEKGQFCNPFAICTDTRGRILVGDSQSKVQVFAFDYD